MPPQRVILKSFDEKPVSGDAYRQGRHTAYRDAS
jgi:hypothetical protein